MITRSCGAYRNPGPRPSTLGDGGTCEPVARLLSPVCAWALVVLRLALTSDLHAQKQKADLCGATAKPGKDGRRGEGSKNRRSLESELLVLVRKGKLSASLSVPLITCAHLTCKYCVTQAFLLLSAAEQVKITVCKSSHQKGQVPATLGKSAVCLKRNRKWVGSDTSRACFRAR